MYKVIGADGKQYGPISLDQLKQWIGQGRVSAQTRVQPAGEADWKAASELEELRGIFADMRGTAPAPGPISAPPPAGQQTGLAITSLVLGILSIICLGLLTGIPAVICGHIAHNRARREPAQYGGAGLAIAGFVMGYAGIVLSIVFVAIYSAMLFPALGKAKSRAQLINCSNNMKQIGLAFKTWAIDNNDQFPFNVGTNKGGTLEVSERGADGFDKYAYLHFLVMSNELSTPRILVCPADNKPAAQDWQNLQAGNVTYQVRSDEKVNESDPQQVLAVCPIHNNVLRVDGSVQQGTSGSRRR